MNTTRPGLNGFQKCLCPCPLDKSSLSFGRVKFGDSTFFPVFFYCPMPKNQVSCVFAYNTPKIGFRGNSHPAFFKNID